MEPRGTKRKLSRIRFLPLSGLRVRAPLFREVPDAHEMLATTIHPHRSNPSMDQPMGHDNPGCTIHGSLVFSLIFPPPPFQSPPHLFKKTSVPGSSSNCLIRLKKDQSSRFILQTRFSKIHLHLEQNNLQKLTSQELKLSSRTTTQSIKHDLPLQSRRILQPPSQLEPVPLAPRVPAHDPPGSQRHGQPPRACRRRPGRWEWRE